MAEQTSGGVSVELITVNHPLDRSDQTRVDVQVSAGTTLHTLVQDVSCNLPAVRNTKLVVSVDGKVYESHQWRQVILLPESQVIIVPVMHGGGGAKDIIRSISMILVTVVAAIVAPGIGGVFTGATLGAFGTAGFNVVTGLAAAGLMMAGAALINAVIPPTRPQLPPAQTGLERSNSYSWNPQSTQQQGIVIPIAYGTCKLTGNIIGTYRQSDFDKQTLNVLISLGEGLLGSIYDLKINGQALTTENFPGINFLQLAGGLNQMALPWFNDTLRETALNIPVTAATPGVYTTVNDDFAGLEIEVGFANGLGQFDDRGSFIPFSVQYKIEISPQGANNWTAITSSVVSSEVATGRWSAGVWGGDASNNEFYWIEYETDAGPHVEGEGWTQTTSEGVIYGSWRWLSNTLVATSVVNTVTRTEAYHGIIRYTHRADHIAPGQYDIKVTRLTADTEDTRVLDDLYLTAVREIIYDDFQYPYQAVVAISGIASERLSGSFEFECRTTGKLVRVYRDDEWHTEVTTSPAWVAWDILTMPILNNSGEPVHYRGYDPSSLNLNHFVELADYCAELVPDGNGGEEPRLTWNGQFDSQQTMWDAALAVLAVGRSTPYWRGNIICLSIDKPTSPSHLFTVGNVLKDSFRESWLKMDGRAGTVEADYIDIENNLERTKITVVNQSAPSHWGTARLPLQGCIRASEAIRRCRYHLNTTQYLTRSATLSCDVDSLPVTMGSVVRLQHDVLMVGKGGRIVAADETTVTLDHKVEVELPWVIDVVLPSGIQTRNVASDEEVELPNGDVVSKLTVSAPFDPVPEPYTVYATGNPDTVTKEWRVVGIRPVSDLRQEFSLAEYNETIYNSDLDAPVLPTPTNSTAGRPVVVDLVAVDSAEVAEGGMLLRSILLSWRIQFPEFLDHVEIYGRLQGLPWQYMGRTDATSFAVSARPAETYDYMLLAVTKAGWKTPYKDAATITVTTRSTSDTVSDIGSLSVTNLHVVGGTDTFNGRDCPLAWDAPVVPPGLISHYIVDILDGSEFRRTVTTLQPTYTYTYGANFDDGSGVPLAAFTVHVRAVDIGDTASLPAVLGVSNSVPATPTGLTGVGELMSNRLTLTYAVPDDFDLVEVWGHTSNDRSSASLVGTTKTKSFLHTGLPPASSRYYWIKVRDLYGQYSPWYPATNGLNVVSVSDPSDVIKLLDDQVSSEKLLEYLQGNTSLLDILDNFQMVFENGVVGPGIVARYTDAIGQNASDLVLAKNQISSLIAAVDDLITGEWNSTTSYTIGQIVRYEGETYRAIAPSLNILPTDTDYWEPVSGIIQLINDLQQNLDNATATWTSTATSITARLDDVEPIVESHTTSIAQNANSIELVGTAITGPLAFYKGEVVEPGVQVESAEDVQDIDIRITNTAFRMDAAESNITLSASRLDTAEGRITSAELEIDGANAAIALKLNATGTAGAGMAIAYDPASSKYKTMFLTDTFLIAQPNGTTPTYVFSIGNINGTPSVGISGQLIVDGTVLARHIAADQLIVGDNVAMGPDAYISWSNVNGRPNTTYINSSGIYTGALTADQVNASGFTAQNANIGEYIQSSNYVTGVAGWNINKNGTAEFRNITARGNIEATSIKAGSVNIIDTLMLQNSAVTVPEFAYLALFTPSAVNTWQNTTCSITINIPAGASYPVLITATGVSRQEMSDYTTYCTYMRIIRNNNAATTSPPTICGSYLATAGSGIGIYIINMATGAISWRDTPGPGTHTYTVQVYFEGGTFYGSNFFENICMTLLGVKR